MANGSGQSPAESIGVKDESQLLKNVRRVWVGAMGVARNAPVSLALAVTLLISGTVTKALWSPFRNSGYFEHVAYGLPALESGRWWTVFAGMIFGLTPWHHAVMLLLAVTVLALSESRIGSLRTVVLLLVSQVSASLLTAGFAGVFGRWWTSQWLWPQQLAATLDVGMTTGMLAVMAVATATLNSPWRLRSRLILLGYTALTLLFEGTLADVMHLFSFALGLTFGAWIYHEGRDGFVPRTRRETRLLAFAGLVFIALTHVLVYFFPGSGPFGPTDAGGQPLWSVALNVIAIAVIAGFLRRGKRWAWWVSLALAIVNVVAVTAVIILIASTGYESIGAVTLGTSILWAAEAAVLISGRYAFATDWCSGRGTGSDPDTVELVKTLIRRHGGGSLSWMITWPGNRYFFTFPEQDPTRPDAVVAYHAHAGAMVALADPICADDAREEVIAAFESHAENAGKVPCWFSVGEESAAIMRQRGWRCTQIAEDTVIDLPDLKFVGKPWQPVRSALNKAKREDIVCRLTRLNEESYAVTAQVRAISEEWVGEKGLPEMGFTLGTSEEAMDPEVRVALAEDASGNIHGVLSWLPVYGDDGGIRGWTLDVMRRRNEGFGPVIEFLIGSSAQVFREEGADFASLSGSPLTRSRTDTELEKMDVMLDQLGRAIEPYYGFRSLHTFKKKFNPRYEPVYLAYRDESDLPRLGVAISRCYLPNATPAQLYRLMRQSHR